MRLRIILVFFFALCTTLAENAFAQPDTTAITEARARIINPISATQTAQLRFGNCRSQNAAGTITINAQTGNRTFGGNGSGNGGNPVGAAAFSVTGEPGLSFSVSLPSSVTVLNGTVTTFTQYAASYTLSNLGTGSFQVGGTLNLPATAGFSNYVINVPITVNYQ